MTRRKPPNRQPRGLRATLPPSAGPSIPTPSCGARWHDHDLGLCPCWHQYDECPCFRIDHEPAHLAAGCDCTWEKTDMDHKAMLAQLPSVAPNLPDWASATDAVILPR